MEISYQLSEIGILLANTGFVRVLKKLTMSFVPAVKAYCIAGK